MVRTGVLVIEMWALVMCRSLVLPKNAPRGLAFSSQCALMRADTWARRSRAYASIAEATSNAVVGLAAARGDGTAHFDLLDTVTFQLLGFAPICCVKRLAIPLSADDDVHPVLLAALPQRHRRAPDSEPSPISSPVRLALSRGEPHPGQSATRLRR